MSKFYFSVSPVDEYECLNRDGSILIDSDTKEDAQEVARRLNIHDRMVEENKNLLIALCDIQSMCIGDIAMGYKLDPESIGIMIYEATGMTHPELSAKLNQEGKIDG